MTTDLNRSTGARLLAKYFEETLLKEATGFCQQPGVDTSKNCVITDNVTGPRSAFTVETCMIAILEDCFERAALKYLISMP